MTILIANIGTSDLSVQPQGLNYYLPIGFDRDEPNEDRSGLNTEEQEVWHKREEYIASICTELEVVYQKVQRGRNIVYDFNFLELTGKILEKLKEAHSTKQPTDWEKRLCPGRIGGVLLEAKQKYGVKDVHIFVTKQDPPQPKDSIYLFEILELWVKQKNWGLNLHPIYLDPKKPANNQDLMLDEYYKFFRTLPADAEILVSIKGGTSQMITALKVQTFAASVRQHLFLDPILNIKMLLSGEYSSCKPASYWQYRRSHKYQTVKLLLNRWDFDGASEVLSDWQDTVNHLINVGVVATEISQELGEVDISQHKAVISSANNALKMAVGYLNLDKTYADSQASSLANLADLTTTYNHLFNLYTQCCLFWEVDRIADFLTRMGSFYEETLHELIRVLQAEQYFDRNQNPDDWYLDTQLLLNQNKPLAQEFYTLEAKLNSTLCKELHKNNCLQNKIWITPLKKKFRLPGRPTKLNFVQALIKSCNGDLKTWELMIDTMKALDFWYEIRNQIIHSAKGVSKERIKEVRNEYEQLLQDPKRKNLKVVQKAKDSCQHDQILTQMAEIARSTLSLMGTTQPPSATESNPVNYLHPDKEPYYIYSDIRKWVIHTLNSDV